MTGGWMFWGLFLALGLIVVGYVVWMFAVERSDDVASGERDARPRATRSDAP